jgi:hypothetical protein
MTMIALVALSSLALAHDPRTVAKDFSHSLTVEGAGKLTISYKSLHFNEPGFAQRKQRMAIFNRVWKAIGKLDTDFEVVIAGVQVPKGSYVLGFNFDENDNYKLVLASGGKDILIPMQAAMDGPSVNYLTLDMRPENDTDTFVLEARYGKLRASAPAKVPFLADHKHDGGHTTTENKP